MNKTGSHVVSDIFIHFQSFIKTFFALFFCNNQLPPLLLIHDIYSNAPTKSPKSNSVGKLVALFALFHPSG